MNAGTPKPSPRPEPSQARAANLSRWSKRLPVALLVVAGGLFTLALFFFVRNSDQRRLQAEFDRRADVPATALQQEIDDPIFLLRSIGAFFFSSRSVDRKEFGGFTKESLTRLRGLTALEWIPRVAGLDRPAHELLARADGLNQYRLWQRDAASQPTPVAVRDEYLPIFYSEPSWDSASLGLDLATDAESSAAMKQARDLAQPFASPPFRKDGNGRSPWCYRIFAPVYTNLVPHATLVERHQYLGGYAAAVMDLDLLVESTLKRLRGADMHYIAWRLSDGTNSAGVISLHQSANWPEADNVVESRFWFEVGGRQWEMECRPTEKYLARHGNRRAWGVLAAGLAITLLSGAYLSMIQGRAAQVGRIVDQRTAELARSNQELKSEIHEREQMQSALAAERDLVNALLDTIPDHLYFKDRESRFIRISRSMAAIFNLRSPDEALGKSDFDFFAPEHARRARADEEEIMNSGCPLVGREEKETWPDGTSNWVSSTKQCLRDKAGNIVGTFGISRDITGRKRAEDRLRVQYQVERILADGPEFDAAAQGILQVIGEALGWNVGAIWQIDDGSDTIRCRKFWKKHSAGAPAFEKATSEAGFASGVGLPGRVWATGKPVWIDDVVRDTNFPRAPFAAEAGLHSAFGFPIRAEREVLGVIEFFSHRIEKPDEELLQMFGAVGGQIGQFIVRKRAELALSHKAKELERSNRELEQFAYVASHDLQEPLRMIASYSQLLQRRYGNQLDADAHQFISFAVEGSARMQALINDLLAYSRVGTRAKEFTLIDCDEVLQRALKNLEIAIEECQAKVTTAPLPRVMGDLTQLTQLFQNLVGNALKFRGEKPAVVHVSAQLEGEAAAPEWHFTVRDEGIGIEPQYFQRIFVIFQRLHSREEYAGTGIGLAVCQKIVERHGGRIWVESEVGQGSTFHFTVPKA